jgi:hypothetical protein
MKGMSMRYLFRPLSTCLLAILLAVLVAGVASAQQEESTAPEGTQPVSPQQESQQQEGLIVRQGESIQEAVNAADPGDTIVVLPGNYE